MLDSPEKNHFSSILAEFPVFIWIVNVNGVPLHSTCRKSWTQHNWKIGMHATHQHTLTAATSTLSRFHIEVYVWDSVCVIFCRFLLRQQHVYGRRCRRRHCQRKQYNVLRLESAVEQMMYIQIAILRSSPLKRAEKVSSAMFLCNTIERYRCQSSDFRSDLHHFYLVQFNILILKFI